MSYQYDEFASSGLRVVWSSQFLAHPPVVPSNDNSDSLPPDAHWTNPHSYGGPILAQVMDPSVLLTSQSHAIIELGAPLITQQLSYNPYTASNACGMEIPDHSQLTAPHFGGRIPPQVLATDNVTPGQERDDPLGGSLAPTNFIKVPQSPYREVERERHYYDLSYRHDPIIFQMIGFPETGVRMGKAMGRNMPPIVGGSDQVFSHVSDREIKLRLIWPGYNKNPREKRVKTLSGTVTRDTMLMVVTDMFMDFVQIILRNRVPVEPGFERWQIVVDNQSERGIQGSELFITALKHRGGANWQPEFYAPKE